MPYIDTIRALILEKEAELARLEAELSAGRTYVRLLESRVKAAEKRMEEYPETDDPVVAVRRVLAGAGQPLFIDEILHALGETVSRDSREQLRRLLLPWVRRGEIFSRPRPGTFGLMEWELREKP
jgi:hypothetical protein